MALTDAAVRTAKAVDKPLKLRDERGLFLLVNPSGSKLWRLVFWHQGKEGQISLGAYPEISLKRARERRDEERRRLAEGINPSVHRKIVKQTRIEAEANSFEAIAAEFIAKNAGTWSQSHQDKFRRRLETAVFPWLGKRPISEIQPRELLVAVRRVEGRGRIETAHRVLQHCGQVFRYAVAAGVIASDPSRDLRGALTRRNVKHHASITDTRGVGELLQAIRGYQGVPTVVAALQLAPLLFVRPGELRRAEWREIDLEAAEWRIPAAKMKMRQQHIVPLSIQAVQILRELQPVTGSGVDGYVFPSVRSRKRSMSENTVNAALRRLGYERDQMTGHGFRSMASTMLNEQGWNRDAIERQLAHGERNTVRAAYNYAEHLPERRKMMQAWADYLDGLAQRELKVVPVQAG